MKQLTIMDIEQRLPGEYTTIETRADSNESVNRQKRYAQIMECFTENGQLTAKQCAVIMQSKGFVPTSERNNSAPRITELCQQGKLEPVGKKKCEYTGKTVAVYQIREG